MAVDRGYTIRLHPAKEGGYWVSCDEVPGALTQGEDVEDALTMMGEAMSLMLDEDDPTAALVAEINVTIKEAEEEPTP